MRTMPTVGFHSGGFVLVNSAAEFSANSAQATRPYRQARAGHESDLGDCSMIGCM